jgi:hypothetical protein
MILFGKLKLPTKNLFRLFSTEQNPLFEPVPRVLFAIADGSGEEETIYPIYFLK